MLKRTESHKGCSVNNHNKYTLTALSLLTLLVSAFLSSFGSNFSVLPPNLDLVSTSSPQLTTLHIPALVPWPILGLWSYTYMSYSTNYMLHAWKVSLGVGDKLSWTVLKLNTYLPLLIPCSFILRKQKLEQNRSQEWSRKCKSYILEQLEIDN